MARTSFRHYSGTWYYRCSIHHQWMEWPEYINHLHSECLYFAKEKMWKFYREEEKKGPGHFRFTAHDPYVMMALNKVFGFMPRIRWVHDCEHCVPLLIHREYDVYACETEVHRDTQGRSWAQGNHALLMVFRRSSAPNVAQILRYNDAMARRAPPSIFKAAIAGSAMAYRIRSLLMQRWNGLMFVTNALHDEAVYRIGADVIHPMFMQDEYGWVYSYERQDWRRGPEYVTYERREGSEWARLSTNKPKQVRLSLDDIPRDVNLPDPEVDYAKEEANVSEEG